MSIVDAFAGGIHAFFSVWVFCLMQVIPFFVAYCIGSALVEPGEDNAAKWKSFGLNMALAVIGFITVFTIMGMTSTSASKTLFQHISLANQFGGVIIGLLALYIAGALTVDPKSTTTRIGTKVFGLALGASLALAYKPCVTPTLTYIYSLTQSGQTASRGGLLLVVYTIGEFTAIAALASVLMWIVLKAGAGLLKPARWAAAAVMMAVCFMILTDKMTIYKSFLVGRFVNQPGHDHSQMNHQDHGANQTMDHAPAPGMDHSQHQMADPNNSPEHEHGRDHSPDGGPGLDSDGEQK